MAIKSNYVSETNHFDSETIFETKRSVHQYSMMWKYNVGPLLKYFPISKVIQNRNEGSQI